ncbi:hypothetical protein GCM10027598_58260 [Amycolatopsis oliviviridis]
MIPAGFERRRGEQSIPEARCAASKVLVVLGILDASRKPLTLTEVSSRSGFPKPTVHRLLSVLRTYELSARTEDNRHVATRNASMFGAGSEGLGAGTDSVLALLRAESTPYLVDLHNLTGATAMISALVDGGVQMVNQIHGHRGVRVSGPLAVVETALGAQTDRYRSSTSIVVARELFEFRRFGVAQRVDHAGRLASVAAPIYHNGVPFPVPIALSVSFRPGECALERVPDLVRRSAHSFACAVRRALAMSAVAGARGSESEASR